MPLAAGQSLTHYELLGPLGAGGMGEVWRARDTRLEREVAIKVLPEHFADDEERLRRFEREAKTLASLNHPNVAGIHGIDQVGETCFLAMELVPGEDLAAKLARGALPVAEALDVCRQIAAGLEAAHEAGVVHRDLKPGNVRVTPDGVVKLLDFGLAKPLHPKAGKEGTTTGESDSFLMTEEGLVLGTPTYMSPEQARGRPVDKRTDVWAFGCVLYECLTGRRAFGGDSLTDVLASIVDRDPDWSALPAATPAHVRALLERCLVKDPHLRLRDVGEARIALGSAGVPPPAAPLAAGRGTLWLVPVALLAGFGAARWLPGGDARTDLSPRVRRTLELPCPGIEPSGSGSAISPDGRTVATISGGRIRLLELDPLEARDLAGTEGADHLAWSPDGEELAYHAGVALWRIGRDGGRPTQIADLEGNWVDGAGLTWGADGRIVFSAGNRELYEVPAAGGDVEVLLERANHEEHFHAPSFLPDGSLVYARHGPVNVDRLEVLRGGERKTILELPSARLDEPTWSPTGHVLFQREYEAAGIYALPFSLERMEATGEPFVVVRGAVHPTVACDGALLHFAAPTGRRDTLAWVDEQGGSETFGEEQRGLGDPALSPDGRRVAVLVLERDALDVFVTDLERGTWTRLTSTPYFEWDPRWAPDDQVLFGNDLGLLRTRADGSTEPELLVPDAQQPSCSRDGRWLSFGIDADLYGLDLERGGEPFPVVATPAREARSALSPDGRWLAYRSDASGRDEIYLVPFPSGPSGSRRWQVSNAGGNFPRWSPRGDRLFYVEQPESGVGPAHMMSVSFQAEPAPVLGVPEPLFERTDDFYVTDYDPENRRFLGVVHRDLVEEVENPLRLTLDWR